MPSELLYQRIAQVIPYEEGGHALSGLPRKYMIACTSRSGSSVLSNALECYGLSFAEYLSLGSFVGPAKAKGKIRTTRDLGNLLAREHAPGGAISIKTSFPDVYMLFLLKELPRNVSGWKIIHLVRRNLVRQAISGRIASLSNKWDWTMKGVREVTDDDYDFSALLKLVNAYSYENSRWERLFALLGCSPMRVSYEEFREDPEGVRERCAQFLGVAPKSEPPKMQLRLRVQSTDMNRRWEERWLHDAQVAGEEALASELSAASSAP